MLRCFACDRNQGYGAWWRHQMETFLVLLALCEGNPTGTGESPSQRPVTRGFDVFFNLRLNKRLIKQSRRRWFKTPWRSLWRHCNDEFNAFHLMDRLAVEVLIRKPKFANLIQTKYSPFNIKVFNKLSRNAPALLKRPIYRNTKYSSSPYMQVIKSMG